MTEEVLRLFVPAVVFAATLGAGLIWRLVHRRRPLRRRLEGLGPGVVLFTSDRCPGCDPVRARLVEAFGTDGFREVKWTEEPTLFAAHRILRVPTTAAVEPDGDSLLWEGMPPARVLRRWKSFANW